MPKLESIQENETHTKCWHFEVQTDHLVDFPVTADHSVKIKESKKIDKYLDLAWERKKLRYKRVMVISIVVGALGKVPGGIDYQWKNRDQQTTALLRSARILSKDLEIRGDLHIYQPLRSGRIWHKVNF